MHMEKEGIGLSFNGVDLCKLITSKLHAAMDSDWYFSDKKRINRIFISVNVCGTLISLC